MTASEERELYKNNRPAWIDYVAPRWALLLKHGTPQDRRKLWQLAKPDLKAAIRSLEDGDRKD